MQEFFGVITPIMIMTFASGLTQWIKREYPELSRRKIQLIAGAINYALLTPFTLITVSSISAMIIFEALFYPAIAWGFSVGFYELVINPKNAQK